MDAEYQMRVVTNPGDQIAANISGSISDRTVDDRLQRDHEQLRVARLVKLAQTGDRQAFGDLYRVHYGPVYRLARFNLPDGAEDVVAEVFCRAWAALPRYRDTGAPFVTWLYGIARHVVADQLRLRGRSEPRERLPERPIESNHEVRLALGDSIARLPDKQRRIIEMKYLMGMTNPEVSKALGKSIGAVNAQQWRALRALQQMLEEKE